MRNLVVGAFVVEMVIVMEMVVVSRSALVAELDQYRQLLSEYDVGLGGVAML